MEKWDLYDSQRRMTDVKIMRGEKIPDGYYHIVVHICIFSSDGKMLIQHRQPFKDGWPDMWDVSAGGSAIQGESSQEAILREAGEEIGYSIDFGNKRPFITMNHGCVYDDFYIVNDDVDLSHFVLQKEEVCEISWADREEIVKMIDCGEFVPYRKELISLLFALNNKKSVFIS